MPATSERTLRLLTLLQARPVWSGRELAERLETTTRTVRTDIARLRELGYQVEGVPGIAGGYRLRSGENVPPLLFDEDEAVAVLVGLRQMISTSTIGMDAAAESAIGKILQLMPARLRNQARAVAEFTDTEDAGHGVEPELIRALTAACQQRVHTRFDYQTRQGPSSRREVEPYRVVNARRRWYLLAWDTDRRDWRTFRLDRMTLPSFHTGAQFEPRPLPSGDPAGYVLARLKLIPWPYQAWVIVDAPASELVDRLAPNAVIEPISERTCRVRLSADSPRLLAPWLGRLEADFTFADPERDADLVHEIDRVRGHFTHALDCTPTARATGLSRK
ncbi:WYL domain-containing protein [Dactylosporangium sp. AC04546]|uniref:helix-turn-helix transcriptional regulator n=1 Tax=Dactylosporangium sp. AC04546 TaxID=2862460 RepID=UPI001EDD7FC3|nr:WYL domain-containing protein [Dactylosporangium sp. AC04546]WVK86423.1 WYL domain-containing protein [Dactylosporangium sp. AC04546]